MLSLDVAAKAARTKNAAPTVSRCGSWHGSASTCPCSLDRISAGPGGRVAAVPGTVGDVVRSPGRPLEEQTRRDMQQRLGHDFGTVRVHDGAQAAGSARAVNALAYTVGEHVVLDEQRLPAAHSERAAVLAHELVHTVQQGPLAGRRLPDRISEPGEAHEREAHQVAGSTDRLGGAVSSGSVSSGAVSSGAVSRAPAPDVQSPPGLSFSLREDGRLDVVARGPQLPGVGKPAAGLRRNVDGTFTVVFGADEKVVAPSEVPPMLRGMVGGATTGEVAPRSFRIPTCASLRSIDQTRWMTFDEYRVTQMLSPGLMPLTPLFYRQLIASCSADRAPAAPATSAPAPTPVEAPREAPHEAMPPLVAEGEAIA